MCHVPGLHGSERLACLLYVGKGDACVQQTFGPVAICFYLCAASSANVPQLSTRLWTSDAAIHLHVRVCPQSSGTMSLVFNQELPFPVSGRTLCELHLPDNTLHVDLNGDGVIDHVRVASGKGRTALGAVSSTKHAYLGTCQVGMGWIKLPCATLGACCWSFRMCQAC